MTIELWVPRMGAPWISQNNRWHWTKRRKADAEWQQRTDIAVSELRRFGTPRALPPCEIRSEFYFQTNNRRDPGNFTATTKPIIDHLVKHYNFWPDDNPEWVVERMPVLRVLGNNPRSSRVTDGVALYITPLEEL